MCKSTVDKRSSLVSVNDWKICGNRTSEHKQSGVRLLSLWALIWRDEFTHAEFASFCERILHQKALCAKLIGLWRSEQSLHLCETSGQLSTERSFDIRENDMIENVERLQQPARVTLKSGACVPWLKCCSTA